MIYCITIVSWIYKSTNITGGSTCFMGELHQQIEGDKYINGVRNDETYAIKEE